MQLPEKIIVIAIDTEIGKTSVSSALVNAFGYEYFKLIQAGNPQDRDRIAQLVPNATVHPNGYMLNLAASPHLGLEQENTQLNALDIAIPEPSNGKLLMELAGGLYCPADDEHFMIDVINKQKWSVVLVVKEYLGCINHTLLSLKALQSINAKIATIVISGEYTYLKETLSHYTQLPIVNFPQFEEGNHESFQAACDSLKAQFQTQ